MTNLPAPHLLYKKHIHETVDHDGIIRVDAEWLDL